MHTFLLFIKNQISIRSKKMRSIPCPNCLSHLQCDFQRQKSMRRDVCAPMHFDTFREHLPMVLANLEPNKKFTL